MFSLLKISSRGLFLALFLITSVSQASALYKSRDFPDLFPDPIAACDRGDPNNNYHSYFFDVLPTSSSSQYCKGTRYSNGLIQNVGLVDYVEGQCPTSYIDDGSGNCIQQAQCPAQGAQLLGYQHDLITSESTTIDVDGCQYQTTGVSACYKINDAWRCSSDLTATGLESPPESLPAEFIPPPQNPVVNDVSDSTDVTVQPVQTETLPDGTVITTETTTTTETKNAGRAVDNGDNSITITDSDGTTTVFTENKVTTTHPDGTKTEVITKDTAINTGGKNIQSINKSTGTVTNNNTNSTTINNNQIITNNYAADGSLISSATVGSGTSTGSSGTGDSDVPGNCGAPGQPACEVSISGESLLTDPAGVLAGSGINEQVDNYIEIIESIGEEDVTGNFFTNPFTFPSSGQCSPASFGFTFHGAPFNWMTKFCEAYDSTLHPILRYLLYGLTVIFMYRTYFSTVTRT